MKTGIDMLFRGVAGLLVVYMIKIICEAVGFPVLAGINPVTFVLSALLGVPGIFLSYMLGMLAYIYLL